MAIVPPSRTYLQVKPNALLDLDSLTGTPPTDAGERFYHEDLPRISSAALWRELTVISLRLALDERPQWWWAERSRRIAEELHRRCIRMEPGGGRQ
jgi:hypothetical protein